MDLVAKYPSYISPARIRTLIVPIGKWKRKDFIRAVNNIKEYSEIRLLDITPVDSPLFTPQGFPNGRLLFDFDIIGHNDSSELFLYDFQPFRKTFVIIGLVNNDSSINQNLQTLKEKYPTAISTNLIYSNGFDDSLPQSLPNVFSTTFQTPKNLETIICDIGHNFLEALSHYYSSYKHVTLRSPGAIGGNSISKTIINRHGTNTLVNPTDTQKPTSNSVKRLSSFEITTNSIKRSASLKLANTLSTSDGRTQQKSRGRQLKILGNFQLLAGRYSDALTSFTESVTLLYKLRDFLWLASAIDGIAICFISLSYLEIPFQVPEIINLLCPLQTVDTVVNNKPHIPTASPSTQSAPRTSISTMPSQLQSPRNSMNVTASFLDIDVTTINLPHLVRKMAEKILYYYELTLSNNSEYVPSTVYCNFVLKTLTFMVACHNTENFSPETLERIVHHQFANKRKPFELDDGEKEFSREDIYMFAIRLLEIQLENIPIESQVTLYITLAYTFKTLGFERKQALVLRLLLAVLSSSTEQIFWSENHRAIIEDILDIYAVNSRHSELLQLDASERTWFILQKNALNLCLSIVKKFDDTDLISKLALKLLSNFTHMLTASEQSSLFTDYIQPCISIGSICSYWDPFIIRNCSFQRLEFDEPGGQSAKLPIEAAISDINKSVIKDAAEQIKTDEVFNPFKISSSKKVKFAPTKVSDNILLVGDKAEFTCTLQNPFKFDLKITKLQFPPSIMEYCELKDIYLSKTNPYVIKAESLKEITIPVILKKATSNDGFTIDSLSLSAFELPPEEFKIVDSERRFPFLEDQLNKVQKDENLTPDTEHFANERCKYGSLDIKIFPEQPQLQIMNKSNIAENSIMILDGTKTKIIINIRNKSLNCPIDYIMFHSITNVEKELKSDYWKKYKPDELFEVEKQLDKLKTCAIKVSNAPKSLKPGEDVQLEIEVDVTHAPFDFNEFVLSIKYGMTASDSNHIYIKELEIPYEVTIQKTVEVANLDIIPLNDNISYDKSSVDWIEFVQTKLENDPNCNTHDFVLLLLDFRNSWLDGLNLQVHFDDFQSKKYLIEANHTLRMIIPVKKIEFLKKGFGNKQIPHIVEGRQFIQSGLNVKQESDLREAFWCREYILERLQCNWNFFHDNNLSGSVDFRKFLEKFDSKMVSTIYKGKSLFTVKLTADNTTVSIGSNIKLSVHLENTREIITDDIPSQRKLNIWIIDQKTSKILPRSNGRVLYNGTLSKTVSTDKPFSTKFDLLPVEPGVYEICAAVARLDNQDPLLHFDSESIILTVN
ncbi:similar to Saccharomyces cerevisiae YDR407C TRS120 One of 10 subunits of the transport protein particle (TRAPP) complex of the cis-Golgi which mediates vesicle docking and fusion [Maudiozyma saulgeensis]|uniref:Similar to Saccharomyces cerevisiae YDR407C TRS120 One of 10 subunits of the transport protein particle (TRAPP) complex of the cis-Golgi which mediates vesicle docking and fusion n=1 Tax=Maudiozyma saulgeensis TaxID=1789683 RepID=A0A1X7R1W3_9SACH|nr:similar to Saccharomyces cerevisiae YDR407C TRS120 One of 10 subunits of the transport protein particle (TRAPP) complex of the cis-Golgi which mediates vesicle docking and fusion [Kazachstania saulgeensis]